VTRVTHVLYLHGFASSPDSSKASRFRDEIAARGVAFSCPDLNQPDFETLTITRMVEQTQAAIEAGPAGPVALVGSSLGGFVAVHAAALDAGRRVDRLVLLAPAFDFGGNRLRQLGDTGIDEWRRRGRLRFFHFAFGEEREVGFGLYEDDARYDAYALSLDQPILIIQGRRDASVDPKTVEAWARERPNVDLRLVDDEHQLSASMDLIWRESSRLLGLSASPEPT
jgi:pimeloyl-ACP methyl ester carboxylesterase